MVKFEFYLSEEYFDRMSVAKKKAGKEELKLQEETAKAQFQAKPQSPAAQKLLLKPMLLRRVKIIRQR